MTSKEGKAALRFVHFSEGLAWYWCSIVPVYLG